MSASTYFRPSGWGAYPFTGGSHADLNTPFPLLRTGNEDCDPMIVTQGIWEAKRQEARLAQEDILTSSYQLLKKQSRKCDKNGMIAEAAIFGRYAECISHLADQVCGPDVLQELRDLIEEKEARDDR